MLRRQRLLQALEEQVFTASVTLVCAPSGFGKTVMVADWARSRDDTQWVSAVRSTDTESLIRGSLLAAFPDATRSLFTRLEPEAESPGILDALAELQSPLVVVIDDAHLLEPEILRALVLEEALLRSGMLRFVLVGQSVLTSQYALELATGAANSIGADEIALTEEEIAELLALTPTVSRSQETQASALFDRTGGWAIAVLLAARAHSVATAGESPPHPDQDRSDADPLLTEYIQTAVLNTLDTELAKFILDTTTCTRLDGWLAERLSDRSDSAELLESCVSQGIFLERLETRSGKVMYRWHDIFARHCQMILARKEPARARQLHRNAAELLSNVFPAEAAQHAFQADAPEAAARIITQNWLRLILDGQAHTLDSLCTQLPTPWKDKPEVLLIRACCLDLSGDNHTASLLRDRAAQLERSAADEESVQTSRELEYIQSFAEVLLAAEPERKAVAADAAHGLLSSSDTGGADPHALFILGWAELRLRRDPFRAIDMLTAAWHQAVQDENSIVALKAQENATFAAAYAGDFTQAERLLESLGESHTKTTTEWELYDGGLRGFTRSYIEYWRGTYRAALEHCDQTLAEGGANTSFLGLANVYRVLAITALEDENLYFSAERTLEEIPEYDKHGVPWGAYRRMAGARLLEVQGRRREARRLADPLLNRSRIPVTHALLADFYRRIEQPALAFLALNKIKHRERPRYARVSALVTFAALKFSSGDSTAAHHSLERALEYASQNRVLAPFLSPDTQLRLLLESHARSGTRHEALLAEVFARRDHAAGVNQSSMLTNREMELLGFLRTTMTAQEIADALHLSLATVKTHQRTLYRKLGVNSRRGALRATQHHRVSALER
jgi:LuxR family maltose regulon positive regulatory protein